MNRDLVVEFEYQASPAVVWRAITEPALIAEWLMENDFRPEVGAKGNFCMPKKPGFDGQIAFEVQEVDPPNRLVYTWDSGGSWGQTTLIWTLKATQSGTKLTLEHRGFEGFKPFLLSLMMGSGWRTMLTNRIPAIVARLEKETQL